MLSWPSLESVEQGAEVLCPHALCQHQERHCGHGHDDGEAARRKPGENHPGEDHHRCDALGGAVDERVDKRLRLAPLAAGNGDVEVLQHRSVNRFPQRVVGAADHGSGDQSRQKEQRRGAGEEEDRQYRQADADTADAEQTRCHQHLDRQRRHAADAVERTEERRQVRIVGINGAGSLLELVVDQARREGGHRHDHRHVSQMWVARD